MSRAVVHLDVDCFYAQVETVRRRMDPRVPLAVRQKGLLVTCNYAARERGLRKCVSVKEGARLCPELVVVPGEDLLPYRRASDRVHAVLRSFGAPVEKLGLDENYVDVTEVVDAAGATGAGDAGDEVRGVAIPESCGACECPEGAHRRLAAASRLALQMRSKVEAELGLTCCAGIAHNKLLAKLAGSVHRPDRQTTLFPCASVSFMSSRGAVGSIPGVGPATARSLSSLGVESVLDLQECRPRLLEKTFGADVASRLKRLSLGVDESAVRGGGRPLSVGVEDSFGAIGVVGRVRDKFDALLVRLVLLVEDDGRRPGGIKVTLRQMSGSRATPHRETRQCHLHPSLFSDRGGVLRLADGGHDKLMAVVMRLFHKSVDLSRPFQLTLLGLTFTKFRERESGRSSIVDYLVNDVSVHSMIDLQNETDAETPSSSSSSSSSTTLGAPSEGSESRAEPSPKKLKRPPCWSPDGLRVADLNLNPGERERFEPSPMNAETADSVIDDSASCSSDDWELPGDVDAEVFSALPADMRKELRLSWNYGIARDPAASCRRPSLKEPHGHGGGMARYFVPNK